MANVRIPYLLSTCHVLCDGQRRHLLPWPIEKIETMEAMGAGRAGQDKSTWDRIAAAMMSTATEAKEQ